MKWMSYPEMFTPYEAVVLRNAMSMYLSHAADAYRTTRPRSTR